MNEFPPDIFLNRELSWLEFNQRVLDQALDPSTPLLERVKFFCICGSNLDEFFEVRVAGIKQQIEAEDDYRICVRRGVSQESQPKRPLRREQAAEE